MIKNERQYRITKAQIEKFESALKEAKKRHRSNGTHPLLVKAEEDALRSQLEDLRSETKAYEALQSGEFDISNLDTLVELPSLLIQARIAQGLTQKELADALGLKEQQMQRYEATNYKSASFGRLLEVMRALGVDKTQKTGTTNLSLPVLLERLKKVGVDPNFLFKRIVPNQLSSNLDLQQNRPNGPLALQVGEIVGRVFGWTAEAIFGSSDLTLNSQAAGLGKFKVSKRAQTKRLGVYAVYAHYLALSLLAGMSDKPLGKLPSKSDEVRKAILTEFKTITLDTVLRYVWKLGIPVLPLSDPSAFFGGCWRVNRRNVIVLKQRTRSSARWLFDLLHELHHAAQHPERDSFSTVELEPTSEERIASPEEKAASRFAGNVLLSGRAEEITQLCVKAADGKVERLKTVVPRIAEQENVPVDALANYMAFRLSIQRINWWGAAENLRATDTDPWSTARDVFLQQGSWKN